jgi:hypothetical protein
MKDTSLTRKWQRPDLARNASSRGRMIRRVQLFDVVCDRGCGVVGRALAGARYATDIANAHVHIARHLPRIVPTTH